MNTASFSDATSSVNTIRRVTVEYVDGHSPRRAARDIRPDVQFCYVFPTQSIVRVATTKNETTDFVCTSGEYNPELAVTDVLVGLDYWKATMSVPKELFTPAPGDTELCYILERSLNTGETVWRRVAPDEITA